MPSTKKHTSKVSAKGLQTAPDKHGRIKNCTPGRSFPCGKACLGIGSYIGEKCLKGLKATDTQKASKLAKSLLKGNNSNTSSSLNKKKIKNIESVTTIGNTSNPDNPKAINKPSQNIETMRKALESNNIEALKNAAIELYELTKDNGNLRFTGDDKFLGIVSQEAGFDGLPQVKTKDELDAKWKTDGGIIMVRGIGDRDKGAEKFFEQFKTGKHHIGDGTYGNGTYVGHGGKIVKNSSGDIIGVESSTDSQDAKRAWNRLAYNAYLGDPRIDEDGVVKERMLLDKDAKIITQKELEEKSWDIQQAIHAHQNKKLYELAANIEVPVATPEDFQKWDKAWDDRLSELQADPDSWLNQLSWKTKKVGDTGSKYRVEFTIGKGKDKKTIQSDFVLSPAFDKYKNWLIHQMDGNIAELPAVSAKTRYTYENVDNLFSTYNRYAKSSDHATEQIVNNYIHERIKKEVIERTKYKDIPDVDSKRAISREKDKIKRQLDEETKKMKSIVLGKVGSNNISSNIAVILGYDAVLLEKSYEPETFMNVLNRSKVYVQDTEITMKEGRMNGLN